MRVHSTRFDKTRRILVGEEIDALLVMEPKNIYYLTGFFPHSFDVPSAVIFSGDNEVTLTVSRIELDRAAETSWVNDVRCYYPHPLKTDEKNEKVDSVIDSIAAIIEEKDLSESMIGVELSNLPAFTFENLKKKMPKIGFKDISRNVWEMRMYKDLMEIENIQKALEIAEKGLRTAIEIISPGTTEIQVAVEVESALRKAGSQRALFESVVVSGSKSAYPYAIAGNKKIEENELVLINIAASYNEYCADVARTIFTGSPHKKHKEIFEVVKQALNNALQYSKPGVALGQLDLVARKVIKEKGYEPFFIHPIGHGIGLDQYEPPIISLNNTEIIREGLILSLEPAIYIPEFGGLKIEETVLITEDGHQVLNKLPIETM
ncbi:MAG: M24 family metallopeptidase [Candidatus Jordarchaeum sp.]|uniref:M24 family metallopeptidase n=1 Tax=Candidatus Jordarchaeum sp. TaxID=2823881 RepID=UPI004049429E